MNSYSFTICPVNEFKRYNFYFGRRISHLKKPAQPSLVTFTDHSTVVVINASIICTTISV